MLLVLDLSVILGIEFNDLKPVWSMTCNGNDVSLKNSEELIKVDD